MASDALLPAVVCVLTFFFFFQLLHDKPMIIMPVGLYLLNASLVFLVELKTSMLHDLKVSKTLQSPVLFTQATIRFHKVRDEIGKDHSCTCA